MQMIMTQCFLAVKSKLDRRLGFFDLIGCNLMVDEDFKVGETLLHIHVQNALTFMFVVLVQQVWLLHMNCNPALHTNCEVLKEVIPSIVVGTLGQCKCFFCFLNIQFYCHVQTKMLTRHLTVCMVPSQFPL